MRTEIMGVGFDAVTLPEAVDMGVTCVQSEGFHYVVTPNPEIVMYAEKDPLFARVLNNADLVLPDGIGIIYSAKALGTPLPARVPGIDFAAGVLKWMSTAPSHPRLFLLGSKPGVAEEAAAKLKAVYPGLVICGTNDGYFKESAPVVEKIKLSKADVLFVCLGAPKQEKWIVKYGRECGVHLAVGLGGALDVFAGKAERAPEAFQKAGLEWFYRLIKEPSRIGRMSKIPGFILRASNSKNKKK